MVGLQSCNCQALMKLSCYHSSITKQSMFIMLEYVYIIYFFLDSRNPIFQKVYFIGPSERVKPRLSHTLTRDAGPESNSRSAMHIMLRFLGTIFLKYHASLLSIYAWEIFYIYDDQLGLDGSDIYICSALVTISLIWRKFTSDTTTEPLSIN